MILTGRDCECPFKPLGLCLPNHEHHRYGCRPHNHVDIPDHTHFWSNDDGRGYLECAFCSATKPGALLTDPGQPR